MFSPVIQKSQYYPILWDLNIAYKLCDGKYMECKLDYSKDYLEELYLLSPNEMDANVFAYEYIKTLLRDNKNLIQHLDNYYEMWKPNYRFISKEDVEKTFNELYKYIDENTK
jgi:hypothetical protein